MILHALSFSGGKRHDRKIVEHAFAQAIFCCLFGDNSNCCLCTEMLDMPGEQPSCYLPICTDLVGYSCLRIPNGDVRDVFVGRCGQKIIPPILQTLASFGAKRCHASKYFSVVCLKNLYFSREYIFILYNKENIYIYI